MRGINTIRHFRSYCTNNVRACKEIKIPVDWGHIAAKWWGPQKSEPILALHGWQVTIVYIFPLSHANIR